MVLLCCVIGELRSGLLFDELGYQLGFTARRAAGRNAGRDTAYKVIIMQCCLDSRQSTCLAACASIQRMQMFISFTASGSHAQHYNCIVCSTKQGLQRRATDNIQMLCKLNDLVISHPIRHPSTDQPMQAHS